MRIPDPEQPPVSTLHGAAREPAHGWCDLCGEPCDADDFNPTAGMNICPRCLEDHLDATAFNARSEVGLARSGGVR